MATRSSLSLGPARIHLIAPAGSCRDFFSKVGVESSRELIAMVQAAIGPRYAVTGNESIIEAEEDHDHGGRSDDAARAADMTGALADSQVAAIVMLRGGAWFTRILPRIDFSVVDRRSTRIALFGFSELTPLVNIVAGYERAVAYYSMGPAFLGYGLKRYAAMRALLGMEAKAGGNLPVSLLGKGGGEPTGSTLDRGVGKEAPSSVGGIDREGAAAAQGLRFEGKAPSEWMRAQLPERFREFFRWCVATIEGRAEPITITARLVHGRLPAERFDASIVGGNLTVLSVMIGSRYAEAIDPTGRWLLLEDYNDKPERFDRYLSHLTLAGFWERCAGVLLGDFHQALRDLTPAVVEMLNYHLPADRDVPVLVTDQVGHTWPMTPVPIRTPAAVHRTRACDYTFSWEPRELASTVIEPS